VIRVAFFAHFSFHRPILEPIRDALAGRAECRLSGQRGEIVGFAPHVLVTASHAYLEYFRRRLPGTLIVNVRHGLVDKAVIARLPRRSSARRFDFVCVGAEPRLEQYERGGAAPREYWHTGFPQLDPLFRRDPPPVLPLHPSRATVLYAPTWNLGLSSAGILGDRLVELIRRDAPDVNIIVKPHPAICEWRPQWMARWHRLAAAHSGVHVVGDARSDVTPYMLAADVLVSDASSVVFAFLALDRPIVLVTNPRHRADPAYDADDVIWRWRDLGREVRDPEHLPAAVAEALRAPGIHGERRRHYASLLFGPFTDGRNHARVGDKILEVGARDGVIPVEASTSRAAAVASFAHELRTTLWASTALRRALLCRLEALRLWVRDRPRAER
jgi:hypothetical protein